MKCNGCPYFSRRIHGHGENFGHCALIDMAYTILEKRIGKNGFIGADPSENPDEDCECKFLKTGILHEHLWKD